MFGIEYRPIQFSQIVGQKTIVKGVQNYLTKNKFPQASVFVGVSGCGKSTTARLVAMALNCEHVKMTENGIEPCCECPSCKDIINERFSRSVTVYNGSDVSIDVIRKIEDDVKYDSNFDKNKILIFEEAQLIKTDAFKSFLTLIENERKNVYFILTSTDTKKFSNSYGKDNKSQETNAFRSRLGLFTIKQISTEDISNHLFSILEKIDPDEKLPEDFINAIPLIAQNSKNNLRQALNDFETCLNCECYKDEEIKILLNYVDEQKESEILLKIANKDPSAIIDVQQLEDIPFNYWFEIISNIALREISNVPFNEQWREKSAQSIINTNNVKNLMDLFIKTNSECLGYFNKNVFIGNLYSYYKNKVSMNNVASPSIVKKIKKIAKED